MPDRRWGDASPHPPPGSATELDPIWMDERQRRIYGNGKRYFFYVSYGVLTEFLRVNVILTYFATDNGDTGTEERICNGGNHARVTPSRN